MLKKIYCFVLAMVFTLSLSACSDLYSDNEEYIVVHDAIDLDDLSEPIDIPQTKRIIKLSRGTYLFTYKKKSELNNKKYVVTMTDMLGYTSNHKPSPDDAYCQTLEIVSADDKSALRAINNLQSQGFKVESNQDMQKAKQMISDSRHLNKAKFAIGIIPRDDFVKNISREIKALDTISVSGFVYKLIDIRNNNKKESIPHCVSMDMLYLTDLSIE